jgi:hypothetical protein
MQRFKRVALIILAVFAIPPTLLALYVGWLEFDEWRFYQGRPILNAMWVAHLRARDGSASMAAEEALLRSFPSGSGRTVAAVALSAEGFYCQTSPVRPGAIDCQIRAPADVGYTRWIVDLYANEMGELSTARVVIGGISL